MIQLSGIEKVYRTDRIETVALADVNMEVAEGEFISVMGPSGCGKSTLLNLIGLLDAPTKGTVQINGSPISTYRDRALAFSERAGVEDANVDFAPPAGLASLVADAAMPARGDEATRWAGYSGLYRTLAWDVLELEGPPARFLVDAGVPY